MRRRGFALLAVLWFISAFAALVAVGLAMTRSGDLAARNRIALIRERWAADACGEIARAHWDGRRASMTGTESLGRDVRCGWVVSDPLAGLNVNYSDSTKLAAVLLLAGGPADSVNLWVARIVQRRKGAHLESLQPLEELDGLPKWAVALLTVEGDGQISTAAPPSVLLTIPGLSEEAVMVIGRRADLERPITSLGELDGLLSQSARDEVEAHYADLSGRLVFRPSLLVLTAAGQVGTDTTIPVRTVETLVSVQPGRLVPVRRRFLL